ASPGGSGRPAMSPDGVSVLYVTDARPTESYYTPCRIMRVALTGGPPQSLGEIQSVGDIRCARTANLCVVTEAGLKQWVLYALDPAKGKGRELLRTGPVWTPGGAQYWDVSPDGSSLAFLKGGVQKEPLQIQVRPLAGGASREVDIGGWRRV